MRPSRPHFLGAVGGGEGGDLVLNVANRGRLSFLDAEAVVEISSASESIARGRYRSRHYLRRKPNSWRESKRWSA